MAVLLVLIGYFVGSMPSAYIAGRLLKGIDIREVGDGNVGAANAYNQLGPRVGVAVLIADACKGVIVVLIARSVASQGASLAVGVAVVMGHNWPVYIGFKGGRGMSAAIGVLSAVLPREMLVLIGVCAVPFLKTRSTMISGAILFAPLWLVAMLMDEPVTMVIYSAGLPCLVGLTHVLTTRRLSPDVRSHGTHMRR